MRPSNTAGIQSGPDAFDKSRFVMSFLTNFAVTEILCSFRLVLEGKRGKNIAESFKIRVPRKIFSKQFCSIKCRRHHFGAVEQTRYSRFTIVEETISNAPKVP